MSLDCQCLIPSAIFMKILLNLAFEVYFDFLFIMIRNQWLGNICRENLSTFLHCTENRYGRDFMAFIKYNF